MRNFLEAAASIKSPKLFLALLNGDGNREIRSVKCKDSGLVFATNMFADGSYSPVTGGKIELQDSPTAKLDDDDMAEAKELVTCTNTETCGVTIAVDPATAKELASGVKDMHCLVCDSLLSTAAKKDDESDDDEDDDTSDVDDTVDEEEEDDDESDDDEDEEDSSLKEEEEIASGDEDDDGKDGDSKKDGDKTAPDKKDPSPPPPAEEKATVSFFDANLSSLKNGKFTTVAKDDKSNKYVFVGDVPVAILNYEKATDSVKKSWAVNSFDTLLKDAIAGGEADAFGLERVGASVSADQTKTAEIEADKQKNAEALESEKQKVEARYVQSLELAFMGIGKQAFKSQDPLRASITRELERRGIENASGVVNSIYANGLTDFVKTAVNMAKEFAAQDDSARNARSEMVAEASFKIDDEENAAAEKAAAQEIASVRKGGTRAETYVDPAGLKPAKVNQGNVTSMRALVQRAVGGRK